MKGIVIKFPDLKSAEDCASNVRAAHRQAEVTVGQSTLRIEYPPQSAQDFITPTLIEGIANAAKKNGLEVEFIT